MGIYLGCLVTIRMTVLQKTIRFGSGQLLSANSRFELINDTISVSHSNCYSVKHVIAGWSKHVGNCLGFGRKTLFSLGKHSVFSHTGTSAHISVTHKSSSPLNLPLSLSWPKLITWRDLARPGLSGDSTNDGHVGVSDDSAQSAKYPRRSGMVFLSTCDRLMEMCRWMGLHFHGWTGYNEVGK